MKEFQELINDGKLSENLMSDEKFVNEAKEILKSENIEVDDKNLSKLISQIENELKTDSTSKLRDEELENISGGTAPRSAIITASSVVGAVTGALVTSLGLPVVRGQVTYEDANPESGEKGSRTDDVAYPRDLFKKSDIPNFYKVTKRNVHADYGSVAGATAASGVGALAGYKIGQLICDKFKIN